MKKTAVSIFFLFCLLLMPQGAAHASIESQFQTILSRMQTILEEQLASIIKSDVKGATTVVVSTDAELAKAVLAATGGEVIQLNPGKYGVIFINGTYKSVTVGATVLSFPNTPLTAPVTITSADPNNRAVVESIRTQGATFWRFDALDVRPLAKKQYAVQFGSDNNALTNSHISYGDSTNWTATDWNNAVQGTSAVFVRNAANVEILNNTMKNIGFGVTIYFAAPNAKVVGNVIDGFSGDALRGLGDFGLFENNIVKNAVQTDDNHSDGFQSWRDYANNNRSPEGVIVRNNTFLALGNYPLAANMQGIGMFDGPYKNWTITNNLVVAETWHGISVYAPDGVVVKNNMVVEPISGVSPGPAWIGTFFEGTVAPLNTVVSDNIATNYITATSGISSVNNLKITAADYPKYFTDYTKGDWSIKAGVLPFSVGAQSVASNTTPTGTTAITTPTVATTTTISVYTKEAAAVYRQPGSRLLGTQSTNAKGVYDTTKAPVLKNGIYWVRINFNTGKDGYVDKSKLSKVDNTAL